MKLFFTAMVLVILIPASIAGQSVADQDEMARQKAYFEKLEKGFTENVAWAYELNMLEQTLVYGLREFNGSKVAYKGNIFRFPLHDSSGYKLLFWYNETDPKICAVANVFLGDDEPNVIITYMDREPTKEERSICSRLLKTMAALSSDSTYTRLPNTYFSFIPLPLENGGQMVVYQRAVDFNTCIFGNDRIYAFNDLDSLTGLTNVHDAPTKMCVDKLELSGNDTAVVYHWHDFNSLKDFPITDLASVFHYYGMHHIKTFSLIGKEFIFKIHLTTHEMEYFLNEDFRNAALHLPKKPVGWTL